MDWGLVVALLFTAALFACVTIIGILAAYIIITTILKKSDTKPSMRTRTNIALASCPDFLYGGKVTLTGTSKISKATIGTIIGFSRMRNEHIGNIIELFKKSNGKKDAFISKLDTYLKSMEKDGTRIPPKQFWVDLTAQGVSMLSDLLFLNYVVIVPKPFGFLAWIPPICNLFAPKKRIVFLDSHIANENNELFGSIFLKGINLNMTNDDYWFVDDERLTKYTLAMCIRSDAYVY
jgi:hypothetical protein